MDIGEFCPIDPRRLVGRRKTCFIGNAVEARNHLQISIRLGKSPKEKMINLFIVYTEEEYLRSLSHSLRSKSKKGMDSPKFPFNS